MNIHVLDKKPSGWRPRPGRRRFVSVGTRLAAVTSLVLVLVSTGLFLELTSREHARFMASKTHAAAMVTQLQATAIAAALDFGDADDVAKQLQYLKTNPDIVGAAVWSVGSETPFGAWTRPGAPAPEPPKTADPDGPSMSPDWLVTTTTIVNPRGDAIGRLRVTFSLAPENDAFRATRAHLFWMTAAVTAAIAALLTLFARRYVVGPLRRLAEAAGALAAGDLSVRVDIDTADEIGDLTRAFNLMGDAVALRQRQVESRNEDMKLVLDHVAQGLFTIDRHGVISPEYSRVLAEWLGAPSPSETLWSYFAGRDRELGERLHMGWEAVIEDILPIELTLEQMPRAVRLGERHLRFGYLPILVGGALSKLLVVLSDVTAEVARDRADAEQRELLQLFQQFNGDPSGFREFAAEGEALVGKICDPEQSLLDRKRWVHTLKGNCAQFGLVSIAELSHRLEDRMARTAGVFGDAERDELRRAWSEARAKFSIFVGEPAGASIEIDEAEYGQLLQALATGVPSGRLAQSVRRWRLEPTARRLDRIARQARGLASRLGKDGVRVVVEPNGMRLDAETWTPFWTAFVHVVRNALDHGIESAEERAAARKQGAGTLTIRTYLAGDEFVIEAADDGRGIAWDDLASRARSLGYPCATRQEIEEALLRGGISSKAEATEYSGRGLGLSAATVACEALGGRLRIQSVSGQGTVLQFRFPASAVGDAAGAMQSGARFARTDATAAAESP
ncbi:MAG TPA: HAMP domain-containing protein [Polyangiaceae bacterium]|jgi:two-component system chemotaxis sensor kinase CheA|nr:HAMP domain-containing protein [Polyangiaceae bacterium]